MNCDGYAPGKPERDQSAKRPTDNGQAARPVRHSSQQKPCDNRAEIAEQEFMGMP